MTGEMVKAKSLCGLVPVCRHDHMRHMLSRSEGVKPGTLKELDGPVELTHLTATIAMKVGLVVSSIRRKVGGGPIVVKGAKHSLKTCPF